jgi:hypothetical protein
MFPHRNIHKYTSTSPEGKTQNQTDHVSIDRRRYSSILNARLFRGADCDTDHYLVGAKVRKRLAVSKRAAQKLDMERFNLKNLKEEDVTGKLRRYKLPGLDQIPAELIQTGGETLRSEIHRLIKLIWNKEELPHQWKESIVVSIRKKGDKTD